jgi:biopolymer transport protein ExbD
MKFRKKGELVAVPMDMTPMIDMVFQLLIFFMLTFKILSQEGDFGIAMPLSGVSAGLANPMLVPPIVVRLRANPTGELAGITVNDKEFGTNYASLHNYLQALVGSDRGPGSIQESTEVELNCDYGLHYRYVVDALTAVTGYVGDDGNVIKLIEKIKFAPPKSPTGR